MKDVPTLHIMELCADAMAQRSKLAVMKDVPTILEEEECAGVMELNSNMHITASIISHLYYNYIQNVQLIDLQTMHAHLLCIKADDRHAVSQTIRCCTSFRTFSRTSSKNECPNASLAVQRCS